MGRTTRVVVDHDEWNALAMRTCNFNVFSSFEWGELKRASWGIRRIAVYDDGEFLGCVQLLLRRPLGLTLGWAPGGVAVREPSKLTEAVETLAAGFGPLPYAVRLGFGEEATAEDEARLEAISGLTPATRPIRAGRTVVFDLPEVSSVDQRMTARHRRSLRKARAHPLVFAEGRPSARVFSDLHREMTGLKGISRKRLTHEDVERLAAAFGPNLVMYSVSHAGAVVAACLILRFPRHAYYLAAASGGEGRELRASFLLVTRVIERLREEGIQQFDFGGIAPDREDARGVNEFKLGFRGRVVRQLGEYDLSNSAALRHLMNRIVAGKLA